MTIMKTCNCKFDEKKFLRKFVRSVHASNISLVDIFITLSLFAVSDAMHLTVPVVRAMWSSVCRTMHLCLPGLKSFTVLPKLTIKSSPQKEGGYHVQSTW